MKTIETEKAGLDCRRSVRPMRCCGLFLAVAGALFSTGAALAQGPTPTPTPQPTQPAEREPGTTTAAATTERIIVTANKIEENVQDVPSSVSVIDDVELDNLHATSLTDYAPYIPGLQVNSLGTPGQTTITLRGLAPISSGATVATYIDETPAGPSGLFQSASSLELDLLPYDIRRVEVLRGPQGTLYGANSIGGLVKYVTLEPNLDTREFHIGGGISGVEGSGEPGWDVHIAGNVPLANNTVGLRLSYARNEIPGFIDNVVNGGTDINHGSQQSALVGLLWQPNDIVSLRFTALGQRIQVDNQTYVALDPETRQPLFGDLTNEVFVDEPFAKNIGLVAATLNLNLGWATFTSATAYANAATDLRIDLTTLFGDLPLLLGFTETALSGFDIITNLDKFTQEFRLTSPRDDRFRWQLGAFYTYERGNQIQTIFLNQLDGTPFPGLDPLADLSVPTTYTEYAGFANASYNFTDKLKLGAGVRFSRNEQSFRQDVTGGGGILIPLGNTPGGSSENVFDFMVTPQFKLGKDQLLYMRIATGYQPGGPNVVLGDVPPSVDSSTVISYEGGLKSEFFDHKLLFDIAGYHIDWTDIQVGASIGSVSFLVNGGEATSDGVELTAAFEPVKGLRIGFNGSYTDATLSNDAPSLEGRAGDRLPLVPEFQASATVDYYVPLGKGWNGHAGAGYRWVGDTFTEVESSSTAIRTESYGAFDLNADVSNDHWTIRVFAKNVTDERAYPTIFLVGDLSGNIDHLQGIPIQPRTVGIEVDFKF